MDFIINLVLLLIIGGLIGYERQVKHGIIGVRSITYISTIVGGDPSRIIAQVVSGTGFIGAGLIFKKDADAINNITTAILVWCLSALGCLIALSHRLESIVLAVIIIIILKYYKQIFDHENS